MFFILQKSSRLYFDCFSFFRVAAASVGTSSARLLSPMRLEASEYILTLFLNYLQPIWPTFGPCTTFVGKICIGHNFYRHKLYRHNIYQHKLHWHNMYRHKLYWRNFYQHNLYRETIVSGKNCQLSLLQLCCYHQRRYFYTFKKPRNRSGP